MFERLFAFVRTAASRGARDRRASHPAPGVAVTMRVYNGAAGATAKIFPFGATIISDAMEQIARLKGGWAKPRGRFIAKAERFANSAKRLAREIAELHTNWHHKFGDIVFPTRGVSLPFYLSAMLALGLGDYAFNMRGFNAWFPMFTSWATFVGGGWQILLVALLPSIVLPVGGHLIGGALKEFRKEALRPTDMVVFAIKVVGVAWIIWTLTILRAEDHTRLTGQPASLMEMAAINAAVLLLGTALAYHFHFDNPEIEHIDKRLRVRKWCLRWVRWRWKNLSAKHDARLGVIEAKADAIRKRAETKVHEYADYNLRDTDVSSLPAITDVVVADFFPPNDFGTRLSLNPPPMTTMLDSARAEVAVPKERAAVELEVSPNGHDDGPDRAVFFPDRERNEEAAHEV